MLLSNKMSYKYVNCLNYLVNGVYEFVNDSNHNANLNHIAKLIEITLMRQPKLSVV